MSVSMLEALAILRKLSKAGDTTKIAATLNGQPLDRADIDFHVFEYVLEAWRKEPSEIYRSKFRYFHPRQPDLTVNGAEAFRERADVDVHGDRITVEIKFSRMPSANDLEELSFEYPYDY